MAAALWLGVSLPGGGGPAYGEPSSPSLDDAPPLLLSEVMVNPTGDDRGQEWIELYNTGDEPVGLAGLAFDVVGVGVLTVGDVTDAAIAPRSYVVLGATLASVGDYAAWLAATQPEPIVEVPLFGDALLPNDTGTVRLLWHGATLDAFAWGPPDAPVTAGAAFNREPAWEREDLAPDDGTWCVASAAPSEDALVWGTPGGANTWCDSDGDGFAEDEGDCDDGELRIAPDAVEVCNGRDDDCDGETDEGATAPATFACLTDGVCAGALPVCDGEAGWRCPYPVVYEEDEASCDGADNDCDGETDEGLRNACGKCGALPDDVCDGVDNDCDGETDEDAGVELGGGAHACEGPGVCAGVAVRCAGEAGWVCDWPPEWEDDDEASCDGLDNDCDGATDEPFEVGAVCTAGRGVCARTGRRICARGGDGTICDAVAGPAGHERCGNGLDDDCDGSTDEGFDLGADCVIGVGACRTRGKLVCSDDGLGTECSATLPPPAAEVCGNDRDDDCDGAVDETPCAAPDDAPPLAESGGCAAGRGPAPGRPPAVALALLALLLLATVTRRRSPR